MSPRWVINHAQEKPMTGTMATEHSPTDLMCLACGGEMAAPLQRTGSLRCHDCRSNDVPLLREPAKPNLVLLPTPPAAPAALELTAA
jgi:hypothetical protein